MPTNATINVAAQVIATRRWRIRMRDVKQTFSQSLKSNRRRPLACRQPRTGSFPGAQPGQLIMLETEVYGLVSGPAWWRMTFMKLFEEQGYVVTPFDRCAMVLPGPNKGDPTEGVAILEMDDVLEAGTERHDIALRDIAKKVVFGKVKAVAETVDGGFS